jgi:hypothetical protein
MGADFSRSAGKIAQQGAAQLASAQLRAGVFGDFEAAHSFHSALTTAHQTHVATMDSHRAGLDTLADKANAAANTFVAQDSQSSSDLTAAGSAMPNAG